MKHVKNNSFLAAVIFGIVALVLWRVDPITFYNIPKTNPLLIGFIAVSLPFSNQFRFFCELGIEIAEKLMQAIAKKIANV